MVGLNLETTLYNKHAHKQCPIYTGLCVYLIIVDALHRAQKKVFFKKWSKYSSIYKNNTIDKLGEKHFYLLEQSFELAWRLKNKKLCDSVWAFRDQEMSDPLELESPLWASLYTGKWTWVTIKSIKCSSLLRHLSSTTLLRQAGHCCSRCNANTQGQVEGSSLLLGLIGPQGMNYHLKNSIIHVLINIIKKWQERI